MGTESEVMSDNFFLEPDVVERVRQMARESGYANPVARIYERAFVGNLFNDVTGPFLTGKEGVDSSVAKDRFDEVKETIKFHLAVGIDDGNRFSPEHLLNFCGVILVLPADLATVLRGYHLAFESGSFLLRNHKGEERLLSSIVKEFFSSD